MIYLSFFLLALVLLQAACLICAAYIFLKREDKWREREMALVDRLLKQAHVPPVQIERENVIKLPDPEIQPASWIDQAFFEDEIKEELEQIYPEIARMSHRQARETYPKDWQSIERRLQEQNTPLRAG